MNEAMEFFRFIVDNSQEMSKQVLLNVYNVVKTKDEKFNEYIMEELNSFDFNIVERELINNIVSVINNSLKPLENSNENNYEAIKNNLMSNLRSLKLQDYRLENNFSDLSKKMVVKFRLPENYIEEFNSFFMSRNELIKETIQKTNNNVIETLIKLSPQLVDELQLSRSKQTSNIPEPTNPTNDGNPNSNPIPNDYNKRDENKPNNPSPVSTYIGATNEDVEKLIKSNEYYSLLHGIDRESFMKYNNFIQTGFNLITSDYYSRASSCNTLEERLQALSELKEIYNNFNGYVTMEQSNQLRETIENMTNYLQKLQSQQLVDDIGIRYNSEKKEETRNNRRM